MPANAQNPTRRSHFIPQAYMRRFASQDGSTREKVYFYNTRRRRGFFTSPNNVLFIENLYESKDRPINFTEKDIARIERECEPMIDGMLKGTITDWVQWRKILRYASLMIARTPATDIFHDGRFGPEYERRIDEKNRQLRQMAIDSSENELAGKPMESYGCSFVSWEHDALITCDFPVMPCNLFDIHKQCEEYRKRGQYLDGYIFPLSPKGLFIIFNLEDAEIFQREFCQIAGLMNPFAINCIAAHYALEYLMARSSDQINQDLIDEIPSNPESDLAYEYMTRLRKTSKHYDSSE